MLDDQLTFRRSVADLSYLTSAGAYNYNTVALISADAAITDAAGNTTYAKSFAEARENPYNPTALAVFLPGVALGGGMTTTGAPTAATLTLTITFSDNGSTQAANSQTITVVVQSVTITANAAVLTTRNYIWLPPVKHRYIQVAWATGFTAGAAPTAAWGPLGLYIANNPNNLIGQGWTYRG